MRELQIITCCENKVLYTWQTRVLCNNYREHGLSDKLQVLVFVKSGTRALQQWLDIQKDYPEVRIHFYLDNDNVYGRIILPHGYYPLIRPYLLSNHYAAFPELSKAVVWYIDPDCILTKSIDFSKYLDDDIVYMSDCAWYVGSKYFDSKSKDVREELKEEYQKIDVLDEAARLIGIDRSVCEAGWEGSGGAQTLLKNVDSDFFVELFHSCIKLYDYFHFDKGGINRRFFESENKGFQTWAIADMNGLLWNLWKRGIKTATPKEFDFSWATSHINEIETKSIHHNAGAVPDRPKTFIKNEWYKDEPWNIKIEDYDNGTANEWYVQQIIKARPITNS